MKPGTRKLSFEDKYRVVEFLKRENRRGFEGYRNASDIAYRIKNDLHIEISSWNVLWIANKMGITVPSYRKNSSPKEQRKRIIGHIKCTCGKRYSVYVYESTSPCKEPKESASAQEALSVTS